jgi:hypothetical protein
MPIATREKGATMSDRLVTIASFTFTPEAQLAKNLLESEGIPAFIAGELATNAFGWAGTEAQLQVRAEDAPRAVSLLAAAEASLEDDWETQAESGVWTCPLCGAAVRLGTAVCPACHTTNPGITPDRRDGRREPDRRQRRTDQVKVADQIQEGKPRSLLPDAAEEDEDTPRSSAGCGVLLFALPWLWLLWLV